MTKPLLIALDYDGTYTADPGLWEAFAVLARGRGHQVHIVTMRADSEPVRVLAGVADRVHYTDRKAKAPWMLARGLQVDVWIDDSPVFVVTDAAPRCLAENARSGLWADPS